MQKVTLILITLFIFSGILAGNFVYAAPPIVTTEATVSVSKYSARLVGNVNPGGEAITSYFEYGLTTALGSRTHPQSVGTGNTFVQFSEILFSLIPNTTYYYRAVSESASGIGYGAILSFKTPNEAEYLNYSGGSGNAPTVKTDEAVLPSPTIATLNGTVYPNGSEGIIAWFEYGATQALGTKIGERAISGSTAAQNYSYTLTNLQPNTTYYYRAVASNAAGTSRGSIVSFNTGLTISPPAPPVVVGPAPIVVTLPESGVAETSAILNGKANPQGSAATAWFEWGTNRETFAFRSPQSSIGADSVMHEFSQAVSGLTPGTRYFYRGAAQNQHGIAYGAIEEFVTSGTAPAVSAMSRPTRSIVAETCSRVTLDATLDNGAPRAGDRGELTVVYKNAACGTIKDVELVIVLPTGFNAAKEAIHPDSMTVNTLTYTIGDLARNGEGTMRIPGIYAADLKTGYAIAFIATLRYKDAAGAAGEETDTATATIQAPQPTETASLIDAAGGLFPCVLIGAIIGALTFGIFWFLFVARKKAEKEINHESGIAK